MLSPDGHPIRVRHAGAHRPGGRGAAEGRAEGRVVHDPARARHGDILVTRTLDPRLAGWLPEVGGIVSETGSVLSHLAILAREYQVPAVVGVHDAIDRFPQGCRLLVDGTTGEVRVLGADGEQSQEGEDPPAVHGPQDAPGPGEAQAPQDAPGSGEAQAPQDARGPRRGGASR
jgi:pyruvate,water dikinase